MKLSLALLPLLSSAINDAAHAKALPATAVTPIDSTLNGLLGWLTKRAFDAPTMNRPPVAARTGSRPVHGTVPHAPARPAPRTVNERPAPPPDLGWLHDAPDEVDNSRALVHRPRPRPRTKPEEQQTQSEDDSARGDAPQIGSEGEQDE